MCVKKVLNTQGWHVKTRRSLVSLMTSLLTSLHNAREQELHEFRAVATKALEVRKKGGQNLQFWVIYLDWLISYGFGIDFWCFLIWVLLILISSVLQWHILPYPSCKIPEYSYDNPRWSQRESESSGVFLGLISDDFRWIRLILN